jgi:hypothetical protein
MEYLLLTGAGFSRNWGGRLASEVFSDLIGCKEFDEDTRQLLFKCRATGGFEDALTVLQDNVTNEPTFANSQRMQNLQSALYGVFALMGQSFARQQFEFQNDHAYQVTPFLARFDAIFTVNQDTLLETHYTGGRGSGAWSNIQFPGMKLAPQGIIHHQEAPIVKTHVPDDIYNVVPNEQPYFKLHGSINWRATTHVGHMIILGGHKAVQIGRYPVLKKYGDELQARLAQAGAKLMVIGYGFNDQHINDAIARGVEKGLKDFHRRSVRY